MTHLTRDANDKKLDSLKKRCGIVSKLWKHGQYVKIVRVCARTKSHVSVAIRKPIALAPVEVWYCGGSIRNQGMNMSDGSR